MARIQAFQTWEQGSKPWRSTRVSGEEPCWAHNPEAARSNRAPATKQMRDINEPIISVPTPAAGPAGFKGHLISTSPIGRGA